MGWSRVSDSSQVVAAGEEITVKVLRIDDAGQKIALGLKQLTDDPWSTVPEKYEGGQVRTARITRLAEFGAFVELEPGRGAGARVHVRTDPELEGLVAVGPRGNNGSVRDPEHRSRQEADWRGARRGRFDARRPRGSVAIEPDAGAERARTSERDELREEIARTNVAPEGFGSLADKLRGALNPREK